MIQPSLNDIAQWFSMETMGTEFFHSLAAYLSKTLQVQYVFIGQLCDSGQMVHSLVFYAQGKEAEALQYPLVGSLCEQVVQTKNDCAFPKNVQQQFPHNQVLKRFGVDSYVATPLKAADGQVIGLLYVMDKYPLQDLENTQLLLGIMAKRASLELERLQQEEALQAKNKELEKANNGLKQTQQALKESNQQLEEQVHQRTAALQASLEKVIALNQTLSKREAFLSNIVNQTSVGIAQTDLSGRFTYANQGYQKMSGRTLTQLQELTIMDITHPDDYPHNLLLLESLLQKGQWFEIEKRYVKPDGSSVWIHNNVSLVEEAPGQPAHIMAVCQDITDRKRVESELIKSEQQLRLITNALPVLISYIDAGERYRFVNQIYQTWFREPISTLEGKSLQEVLGSKAYEQILPKIRKVLLGEEQHFEREVNYRHVGIRFVEVHYIPHFQGQQVVGFYSLVTDITMHKQIEQELKQAIDQAQLANEQLSSSNADLDNFVYMASHDLKAPINNIEGLIKILSNKLTKQAWQNEDTAHIFNLITDSVSRFHRTLTQLSLVMKFQQQPPDEPVAPLYLEEVVEDVILDIQPQILESQAHIAFELEECPSIVFSRKNLRSIVYNLVSNAIKYRSPERKALITLSCQPAGEEVVFSVQDNGLGLSEEGQKRLFSLFKRLHSHVEGSGVGLYLVKKMLHQAGGRIEVESTLGKGSIFRVYLPKASR